MDSHTADPSDLDLESDRSPAMDLQGSLRELLALAGDARLYHEDFGGTLERICRAAAAALRVDRVNVWLLEGGGRRIRCVGGFDAEGDSRDRGSVLEADDAPSYFDAFPTERVLAVENVREDPRTPELLDPYLEPLGIGALLDAPVRREDDVVGIVCHEHRGGSRGWTTEEERLAASVADFVALALEGRDRQRAEEKYRSLFELSHDVVLLFDESGTILEANRHAGERLGYEEGELEDRTFRDLHPPEDLELGEEYFRRTLEEGDMRFSADLLKRDGTTFPADITATRLRLGDGTVVQAVVRDMTERVEAERALRASERRYRLLFERNVAGVFRSYLDGEILEVNEACARMLGYRNPDEVKGTGAERLYVDTADRDRLEARLRSDGVVENYEQRLRRRDGTPIWVLESSVLVENPSEGRKIIEGTLVDITRRKQLQAELERMAYRDSLTTLPNRRLLRDRAEKALALARRGGGRVALIYVDLVRFKRINDTLGHAAGDRILVETAEKLRARMREADTAARVGGDEFAVLLTDVEHPEGALAAARRLAEEFELPCRVDDRTVHLDARLGVALFPDHADDFDALLSAADRAMYASKRGGFPTISLYRPDEEGRFRDELALEEALRSALDQDQLTLYYQPIFGMPEGTVEGAEALLRWHHPERGLLSAEEFVHLSERTPLVQAIDRWVVEQAVAQAARWSGEADPNWVTVNLSAATFRDPELATRVERHLKAHDVDPGRLVVELAERTAMRNPDVVVETLLELRELGVRVAIDDFGTGHSALAYLKQFPADLLKLDGQFIQDLTEGDEVQGVARAVMDLGRAVGMEVVAERVEEASQFRWLDEAGCAFVQGFYTGEPVPPDAIRDEGSAMPGA